MDENNQTNLFKANSIVTLDKSFIKNNTLESVRSQTTDYVNYINKNIRLIHEDTAIRIPVKEIERRYYLEFNKEEQTIKERLFNNKIKNVLVNNKNLVPINYSNENFIFFKTKIKIETITVKLDGKNVLLRNNPTTAYSVELEKLKNNREAEKVDTELFENDAWEVFIEKPSINKNTDSISIKTRENDKKNIILNTEKKLEFIYLKGNDYQLKMQLKAIKDLRDNPRKEHTPIQKLFDPSNNAIRYFEENIKYYTPGLDFKILNNLMIDGVKEQQNFVKKALKTNDFALLEGPPGSGKTTAIIELIIQLIKQNKRVLLVSATHVAVDNVIHRILTKYKKECEGLVVPLRIAPDIGSIRKKSVEPYRLETFIKKTKAEITKKLSNKEINDSGRLLLDSLINTDEESGSAFDDVILKSANLVGGTMIGILQHPDIKNKKSNIQELFDVMIVDESSKVTFSEFIVPALHAKKWILVGDVKQLSPYTEPYFVNENVDAIIKEKEIKNKLVKAYNLNKKLSSTKTWDKESVKILFSNDHNEADFEGCEIFKIPANFKINDISILKLNSANVIICEPTKKHKEIIANYIYVKAQIFESKVDIVQFKNRQKAFHKNKGKNKNFSTFKFEFISAKNQEWKELVGSNLSQMYQYRFDKKSNKEYNSEFEFLVPIRYRRDVEKIRRIAMPSILELLQIGVGNANNSKDASQLIYKGFNYFNEIKDNKFQTLSYQHRMEDEIASLSRDCFYTNKNQEKNLQTANTVIEIRENLLDWYKPNEKKVIWITNNYQNKKTNKIINIKEVNQIELEIKAFINQAKNYPTKDNSKYEIAVLSFYNDQVDELRNMLRRLSNKPKEYKFFEMDKVDITLSTVDKFQGDEADMVLLSFTKATKKAHYNSPNRLNVALTRARFKLIMYGNKVELARNAQLEALRSIAKNVDNRLNR